MIPPRNLADAVLRGILEKANLKLPESLKDKSEPRKPNKPSGGVGGRSRVRLPQKPKEPSLPEGLPPQQLSEAELSGITEKAKGVSEQQKRQLPPQQLSEAELRGILEKANLKLPESLKDKSRIGRDYVAPSPNRWQETQPVKTEIPVPYKLLPKKEDLKGSVELAEKPSIYDKLYSKSVSTPKSSEGATLGLGLLRFGYGFGEVVVGTAMDLSSVDLRTGKPRIPLSDTAKTLLYPVGTGKQLWNLGSTDPLRLSGQLTGMYAIGKASSKVLGKKTVGDKYPGEVAVLDDVKQAIKEGAFTREEVKRFYGVEGLNVFDKAMSDFKTSLSKGYDKLVDKSAFFDFADDLAEITLIPAKDGGVFSKGLAQAQLSPTNSLLRNYLPSQQVVKTASSIQDAIRQTFGGKEKISGKIGDLYVKNPESSVQMQVPDYSWNVPAVTKKIPGIDFSIPDRVFRLFNKKAQSRVSTVTETQPVFYKNTFKFSESPISEVSNPVTTGGLPGFMGETLRARTPTPTTTIKWFTPGALASSDLVRGSSEFDFVAKGQTDSFLYDSVVYRQTPSVEELKPETRTVQETVAELEPPVTKPEVRVSGGVKFVEDQDQIVETKPVTEPEFKPVIVPPITIIEPFKPQPIIPTPIRGTRRKKRIIIPFFKPSKLLDTKKQGGFGVSVRKKGVFQNLPGVFSKEQALRYGSFYVDTTPYASFRVTKKGGSINRFFSGSGSLSGFYSKNGVFVEKPKKRIDTIGELQGITFKGWQAKKNKVRLKL